MKNFNLKIPLLENHFSPPKLTRRYLGMACLFLLGFLQPYLSYAQTFNGTTGPIPDATVDPDEFPIPSTVDFTANVTGLLGTIGTDYTIANVTINIEHTWDSDLDISLVGPDGTTILNLSDDNGDNGFNYTNTVFTDAASINITAGFPPFTGSFKPEGPGTLASVFNGSAVNGIWTLRITDDTNFEEGTLLSWSITFQAVNPPVVLNCPSSTTTTACQTQSAVNNAFSLWLLTASATGGCNGVLSNNSAAQGGAPPACGGSRTVTFTYTSTCIPFTTTCQATFSVPAAPPVTVTCPINTTTAACQTQAAVDAAFAAWLATGSGSGGCGGSFTNNSVSQGGAPPACGGSRTVTFTYTSSCAPFTTTCNATFVVAAPASPTPVFANCTNNTVNLGCNPNTLPSCAGITGGAFGGAVTASNTCGAVPVTCSAGSITINGCNRTQMFTFEATACGQTSTCTRTFTWTQVTPPSFGGTCGNGVTNLGCNPGTLPSCDPNVTASNECGPITVTCNVGTIIVNGCNRQQTLLYVANAPGCGTFSTCQRVFNWQVTTAPVFGNCGNTIDLGCNPATLPSCANISQAAFGGAITATNECGNVTMSCTPGAITSNGCNRTQIFTISATACGLMSTCTRTFTWTVATAPVFANCTSGTTNLGCDPAIPPSCDPAITASNECGAVTVNCTAGAITVNGCNRSQVLTYTATACGLTSTCARTYIWKVNTTPMLNCPTNTVVAACQTQAAVNAQFEAWLAGASFSGACNGVMSNNNTGAPSFCGGSVTITFTLNTDCQAPVTCQATFTVTAAPPPSLTCPNPLIRPLCQTRAQDSIALQNWVNTSSFGGGCNGSISFNGFTSNPPSSCGGTKTLTLTYTSSCAAPLTCTSTFTIPAPTAPVLTCPTNTTVPFGQTQAQVNAAFVTWLSTASGTGGCNGVLSNNNIGAPPATGGSVTVTFTYSQNPPSTPFIGACPFSPVTCQATFSVSSVPPVVLTCPVNTTASACLTQAQLNTAYNAWLASASGSGGCNGVLTNNSPGAPSICSATAVSQTVTFTYQSSCAPFTTSCQATFTVPAYPDFNGPPNSGAVRVCLAQTEQPIPPVINDACGKPITPTGPIVVDAPNSLTCEGTRTYIFTYTDCAGHSHDWSFVWTLDVPTLSVDAPGIATVSCPSAPPPTYPNTITDACGRPVTVTGPTVTSSPDPITCEGTRTYTWNLTDCAGNTNTWSYIINIERNDFTLPANGSATVTCPAAANVVPTPPSKMSQCGEPIIPTGPVVSATPTCEGTKTYTWTYTDCEGNSHDWMFTYTIERNPFTVPANGAATVACPSGITIPTPPIVTSNCGESITPTGPTVVNSPDPLLGDGTRTYTWTYVDCEGNTAQWSFTFTVNDAVAPTVTCPAATATIDVEANNACAIIIPDYVALLSPSDNCTASGNIVETQSVPAGLYTTNVFHGATVQVTYTASDGASPSNSTACTVTITVNAPEVDVQGNSVSILDGDSSPGSADHTDFGQTSGANITRTFTIKNVGGVPLPITGITLGGADPNQFTVGALTPPSPIPANGSATFTVTYSTNILAVHTATVNIANGDCNEANYDFAIRAELSCMPATFTNCPSNLAPVNTSADLCKATVNYSVLANGMPAPTLAYTFSGATTGSGSGTGSGSVFNKGVTTVTVTATNPCSTPTCSFTVTVVDLEKPKAFCKNISRTLNNSGVVGIAATDINNNSTDNCGIASISCNKTTFNCTNFGANTVVLTVTDVNGNSQTCTATVSISYNQAPVAKCRNAVVVLSSAGNGSITPAGINNGSTDVCSGNGLTLALSKTTFNCSNIGANIVTLTVTNVAGTSSTCTGTVTIKDQTKPVAKCKNVVLTLASGSSVMVTPAEVNNSSTDACTSPPNLVSLVPNTFTCANSGANAVTLTVSDGAGNVSTCSSLVTINCNQSSEKGSETGTEANLVELMDLFPNPAADKVNIRLTKVMSSATPVTILDNTGRTLFTGFISEGTNQLQVDLNQTKFASGIYQVSIILNDRIQTKSLVIFRN